ncbi:MAG: galactosyltransferase-related protein, partial [Methanobacteriaceae archaeon]|nr:galactosyltransferase-related protein [Methanobacteriaceae archaeon]
MKKMFPKAQIVIAGDPSEEKEYCRAHSINHGVSKAKQNKLIIMDSDIYLDKEPIVKALEMLDEHQFVLPFGLIKDITPVISKRLLDGQTVDYETLFWNTYMDRDIRECQCAGGMQIITKELFNKIGGYDERFIGWGYEDTAFCFKVRKELGNYPILEDTVGFHLYHERNN